MPLKRRIIYIAFKFIFICCLHGLSELICMSKVLDGWFISMWFLVQVKSLKTILTILVLCFKEDLPKNTHALASGRTLDLTFDIWCWWTSSIIVSNVINPHLCLGIASCIERYSRYIQGCHFFFTLKFKNNSRTLSKIQEHKKIWF